MSDSRKKQRIETEQARCVGRGACSLRRYGRGCQSPFRICLRSRPRENARSAIQPMCALMISTAARNDSTEASSLARCVVFSRAGKRGSTRHRYRHHLSDPPVPKTMSLVATDASALPNARPGRKSIRPSSRHSGEKNWGVLGSLAAEGLSLSVGRRAARLVR